MLIELVKNLSPFNRLAYWIQERERIRTLKESGLSKPWTDDVILQSYRFCNVRRMDDKVSQWLLRNWYGPNKDHPNMLIAACLARFFNLPNTLDLIGFPTKYRPSVIKSKLRKLQASGATLYNNAYMVRGNDGVDKIATVVDFTIEPIRKLAKSIIDIDSMELTWLNLKEYHGFGSFMAGQIVADLRHAMNGDWSDRYVWAAPGPGSMRGLNRLLGNELNKTWRNLEFNYELGKLCRELKYVLSGNIPPRLEAIDYQNCLCELDKYCRVLFNEGKPKQRYPGR